MGLTDDPNDPRLVRGSRDSEPTPQHPVYLVLSEEERTKGFVRPLRHSYAHVGMHPRYYLRDLTPEEHERYDRKGYVKFEPYPEDDAPKTGRFWTQEQLDASGCGTVTSMGTAIAETYARSPGFYGATYCCGCNRHLPVAEFRWVDEQTGAILPFVLGE
jgi:hypothetical protein